VAVGGGGDAEAATTAGAGQHALEVVDVLLRLLADLVAGVEDGLYAVEGGLVGEWWVVALRSWNETTY
jgi:hypothetical protein